MQCEEMTMKYKMKRNYSSWKWNEEVMAINIIERSWKLMILKIMSMKNMKRKWKINNEDNEEGNVKMKWK